MNAEGVVMNKYSKKLIYSVFVDAKKHLSWVNQHFICWAITDTNQSDESIKLAISVINERLEGYYCIEDWLTLTLGFDVEAHYSDRIIQEYRHRWLDSLIDEFSS